MLFARIMSLLIGYLCGCVLTAEIVARRLTGKSCSRLGTTGNPGMANVMANLGFVPGIIVLAGDLAKEKMDDKPETLTCNQKDIENLH